MYGAVGYGMGMGELSVVPLDAAYPSAVTSLAFSHAHEALWAGTDSGHVYAVQAPSLAPYAHWQAHPGPVLELAAVGEGVMSLSHRRLALHGVGGAPRWSYRDETGLLSAVALDGSGSGHLHHHHHHGASHPASKAVLGRSSSWSMTQVDLATGKTISEQDVLGLMGGEGMALLRGPLGRGALCAATTSGRLAMVDVRAKPRLDGPVVAACPGGIAAMDARGDTVAVAGYGLRAGGVLVPDNCVRVFDLRAGLRQLLSMPTAGLAASLAFHPLLPSGLLVALPSALFCIADTATGSASHVSQVDMATDQLTAACLSPSGELVALGGSGGYVHTWAETANPRVNAAAGGAGGKAAGGGGGALPMPPARRPRPTVELREDDGFATAPQYPLTVGHAAGGNGVPGTAGAGGGSGQLASAWDPHELVSVGLPPRVVDAALRRNMRVVDGVGYIPNPHYSRAKSLGHMVSELASTRAARLSMRTDRVDPAAARAERQRQRAAEGGVVLPLRYQFVEIRNTGRLKWEEFDFSYYNRTRFAGLENDLPSAYCNALLQALYFVPEFRQLVLSHMPEPDAEFCLTCELSFLFAMLQRAHGSPCQATNLLRTLRSLREAAALGLLDGGGIGPAAGTASDAAALAALAGGGSGGDTELSRRVAALSRFVLEQMHRDATNARTPSTGPHRSGITPQPAPANASLAPGLESLMGMTFKVRMTCLTGDASESVKDARVFQVDLQYPASRDKAAKAAEEARQLGISRLPGAALPADDPGTTPSFAELLRRSLLAASCTRAWVEASRTWALVRRSRVPTSLPRLLTVNVAVADADEAAWWLPAKEPDGSVPGGEANRLPWAVAVVVRPESWEVEVHQADTPQQLFELLGPTILAANPQPSNADCAAPIAATDPTPAGAAAAAAAHKSADRASSPSPSPSSTDVAATAQPPSTNGTDAGSTTASNGGAGGGGGGGAGSSGPLLWCVYALCGAVYQIRDLDEAADPAAAGRGAYGGPGGRAPYQGHLVTMVKVPQEYWDEAPEPRLQTNHVPPGTLAELQGLVPPGGGKGSGGSSGAANTKGGKGGGEAAKAAGRPGGGTATAAAAPVVVTAPTATTTHGTITLPDDLDDVFSGALSLTDTGASATAADAKGDSRGGAAHAGRSAAALSGDGTGRPMGLRHSTSLTHGQKGHPQGPEWVLFNDFSVSACPAHEVTAIYANQKLPCLLYYKQVTPPPHLQAAAAACTPAAAAPSPPPNHPPLPSQQTNSSNNNTTASTSSGGGGGGGSNHRGRHQPKGAISYAAAAAAGGGGKGGGGGPNGPNGPLLTPEQFRQLCGSPPLQGSSANLPPFRFKPLDPHRMAPRPGVRFAIDAEFVATSPPVTESRAVEAGGGGVGVGLGLGGPGGGAGGGAVDLVQLKQARLTLARVAVVYAEPGSLAGSCVLDDYIRSVEPVFDYLTRWSGIQPGDLDPAVSRHYTTTTKHTFLKLRYLLDCGCVFVGHDLRKDFRCINMVVPPEQVIDTSELFRHRGCRKLSLRFLASYLLGASIQTGSGSGMGHVGGPGGHGPMGHGGHGHVALGAGPGGLGHDAIEDARTAMRLYHKYLELVSQGSFERVLDEMYAWGKQYGWEPVTLRNGVPQPPVA